MSNIYRECVGIMLINDDGDIFVGKRLDSNKNAWQMPQGGIDKGETTTQAALRELEEETSISDVEIIAESSSWYSYDIPKYLRQKLWSGRYVGQTQKWFLMRFKGDEADINIATKNPEFGSWRWINIADLADAIVPFKKDTYEQVIDEFSHFIVK